MRLHCQQPAPLDVDIAGEHQAGPVSMELKGRSQPSELNRIPTNLGVSCIPLLPCYGTLPVPLSSDCNSDSSTPTKSTFTSHLQNRRDIRCFGLKARGVRLKWFARRGSTCISRRMLRFGMDRQEAWRKSRGENYGCRKRGHNVSFVKDAKDCTCCIIAPSIQKDKFRHNCNMHVFGLWNEAGVPG